MDDVSVQFQDDLLAWAEENEREFPWRRPGATLYEVFLAEFFLTQTPAEAVAEVYPDFLDRYPSLEDIERASVEELAETLEPLGLYNRRAKALVDIASRLDGELPEDPEELQALPRVGPYVASATATIALDYQLPLIDTNVRRIYGRIFGEAWSDPPDEQVEFATRLLPEGAAREYNLGLLDFGAKLCKPKNPKCEECFARSYCEFYKEERESA